MLGSGINHTNLTSRESCDNPLCSTCVQGASVNQMLQQGGLLIARLIGPDQLVTAVQVGYQELTIVVTYYFVITADAGDGA